MYNYHDLLNIKHALDTKQTGFIFHVTEYNLKHSSKPIVTKDLDKINKILEDYDMIDIFIGKPNILKEVVSTMGFNESMLNNGARFIMEILRKKDQELSKIMFNVGIIPQPPHMGEL